MDIVVLMSLSLKRDETLNYGWEETVASNTIPISPWYWESMQKVKKVRIRRKLYMILKKKVSWIWIWCYLYRQLKLFQLYENLVFHNSTENLCRFFSLIR